MRSQHEGHSGECLGALDGEVKEERTFVAMRIRKHEATRRACAAHAHVSGVRSAVRAVDDQVHRLERGARRQRGVRDLPERQDDVGIAVDPCGVHAAADGVRALIKRRVLVADAQGPPTVCTRRLPDQAFGRVALVGRDDDARRQLPAQARDRGM